MCRLVGLSSGDSACYPTWYRCLKKKEKKQDEVFQDIVEFKVVKVSKAVKRDSFSDNTAKGCFHRNSEHIVQGPFVDPLFKHGIQLGAKTPPLSLPRNSASKINSPARHDLYVDCAVKLQTDKSC